VILSKPGLKILRGTKPADIPVEQPTMFRLVVNLKTRQGAWVDDPGICPDPSRRDYRIGLLHLLMAALGTSRQFIAMHQCGRYWS
jgi:hypothetical protein